jgi:biopolymer transport protein ExbB/TolQ
VLLHASTTLIAAVSAAAAVAGVVVYVYGLRRANQTAARDEALALAETRRQMVNELRRRVAALEHGQKEARAYHRARVRELKQSLERTQRDAREQAYRAQRLYVLALGEAMARIRDELEKDPPNVKAALARIQEMLADEKLRSNTN